jgi:hypothetical protein
VPERLVELEEFEHSEYLLLVRCATHFMGDGKELLFTYALLGDGIWSIEDGRLLYAKLNQPYEKEVSSENLLLWDDISESFLDTPEGESYQRTFLLNSSIRHIEYFSPDGLQVLCFSHLRNGGSGAELMLEVYKGRSQYDSMSMERIGPWFVTGQETPITLPKHESAEKLIQAYLDRMTTPFIESYMYTHPYVKEYEKLPNGPLFSPDEKYYAYRSPQALEQKYYQNDDGNYIVDSAWWPFGNPTYGYYIRNVETGDTVFYESEGEAETICWVKKAAIDALLAENEGKGPVE